MFSIWRLTIKETMVKKTTLAFFILSTIFIILFLFAFNIKINGIGSDTMITFFGMQNGKSNGLDLANVTGNIQAGLSIFIYIILLFFSLFSTSDSFTSILKKGSIGLIISKPIPRYKILSGRFLGNVTVVSFNVIYLILSTWIILSVKTGIWNGGYLFSALLIIITYAVMYTVVMLFSILTSSTSLALIVTYGIIIILNPIITAIQKWATFQEDLYKNIVNVIYYSFPRISDIGIMMKDFSKTGSTDNFLPLYTSIIFGIVVYFLSAYFFKKKDF